MSKAKGLVLHHDPNNEKYPLRETLPLGASVAKFEPASKRHRVQLWLNQGSVPACTAYGSLHLMADGPVNPSKKPLMNPLDLYKEIQAFDRAHGRIFPAGATVVAAMEVMKTKGWISAYHWGYTLLTFQMAILEAPVVFGTLWFPSMNKRDREGIVRLPGPHEKTNEGHYWIASGYDHKRGLTLCHQTWGPPGTPNGGFYLIPDELLHRLIRDGGEFCQVTENPLAKRAQARKRLAS